MAIKPTPQRIDCPQCGWHSHYAPDSDALISLPPESCEKCGSTELNRQPAGFLDTLTSSLIAALPGGKR